jgi:hypothetical protein
LHVTPVSAWISLREAISEYALRGLLKREGFKKEISESSLAKRETPTFSNLPY